ncbi:hypothetical protein SDC9_210708 [bioreactor metagenome]|uniref:Uncharacterized protein n=1 Tax=bioreactor metagenome TaxID=1076179 RepID=A0A645JGZ7_9ZZZZ
MHIGGDLPAQLGHARVGGILRKALFQGIDPRVTDMPRGNEVRFADAEGNGVFHFFQNIEKSADARGRNLLNPIRQNLIVIHVKINSLS